MFVDFDMMPETSRVWIYQGTEKFSEEQTHKIEESGKYFCENWEAHGNPLKSSVKVLYNQFVVVAVDENYNDTTGCSIDKSVALVQSLENTLGISLFDRTKIAFMEGDRVFVKPLQGIKSEISTGVIHEETVTFNNLVKNLGELKEKWQVPVGNSWLKRYFA